MINKILGISSVDSLQKKSSSILDVFTNTLKQLEEVNVSIVTETTKKQILIDKA